jgi:pimeloyl-ACP methyl ester carboxylesterase
MRMPDRKQVLCASATGLHALSYIEWGDPRNDRVVVCLHALSRCARDFDALAGALANEFRVVCPDLPGRGESDWLPRAEEYVGPTYFNDMITLIARLNVERVCWVGTSLGALIGMAIGAQQRSPIARLVVNDAGPVIAAASIRRILGYLGKAPLFQTLAEAERYVREVSAPFGPHDDEEWRFLTEHAVRRQADGTYRMHYDPAIAVPFATFDTGSDTESWPVWDAIRCPTLVLRGAASDLLTRETAVAMTQRGPRAQLLEFPGVGHAPTLLHADQIAVVREFLLAQP